MKWETPLATAVSGFFLGIFVQHGLDMGRALELESLQDDSVYCGFIIEEHAELEKMLIGKDERIQGLMNEIENSTDRFGYELDSCSEGIGCCEDLEFVVAEWDTCLSELLSPGIYIPG